MKICTSTLLLCHMLSTTAVVAASNPSDHTIVDLPDTTGIAAELADFQQLDALTRQRQIERAAYLSEIWLSDFSIKDGRIKRGIYMALASACAERMRGDTYKLAKGEAPNILGFAITDLKEAVKQDPTEVMARVSLGLVQVQTGSQRAGINHLEKSLIILGPAIEKDEMSDADIEVRYLRKMAYYYLALGYRDFGAWDQFGAAVEIGWANQRSPIMAVLKGLHLAGSGQTSEAISWAVRMPALEFPHQSALSSGRYARPADYANRWIKSQALFAAGDLVGARYVLGELKTEKRQRLPFGARFWEDAGLICELLHDPAARGYYNMAALKSFMGFVYPSNDGTLAPVVLDFPSERIPFFTTPAGGFEAGSPFAYIAAQMNIMAESTGTPAAEKARVRALDICQTMLRRQIQPDLVRAFRARVHMANGREDLAHPDLEFAQAGFAARGLVDPGTSILLGQQELLAGNNARSRALFDEALAVLPNNALAYRELGIALGRAKEYELARKAMNKALELEPDSMAGWFNLGILDYRNGAYEEALTSLEKAWTLEPGNMQVQKMLQTVGQAQRMAAQ